MIKSKKLMLSEMNMKHLRIVGYLIGSWAIALGMVYLTKNENLVGLAPVLNYLGYVIEKELKNEGYIKILK